MYCKLKKVGNKLLLGTVIATLRRASAVGGTGHPPAGIRRGGSPPHPPPPPASCIFGYPARQCILRYPARHCILRWDLSRAILLPEVQNYLPNFAWQQAAARRVALRAAHGGASRAFGTTRAALKTLHFTIPRTAMHFTIPRTAMHFTLGLHSHAVSPTQLRERISLSEAMSMRQSTCISALSRLFFVASAIAARCDPGLSIKRKKE